MDAEQIAEGRRRWEQNYRESRTRDVDFTTLSGLEVDPLYAPRRPRRASRGLAGPVSILHPGAVSDRIPGSTLDDPAVRWVRQRAADQ